MIIVNPNQRNPSPQAAIEAPVWCAYLAKNGDEIWDLQVMDVNLIGKVDEALIVVMGANPSASSTPKMADVRCIEEELEKINIRSKITGLHPIATDEATYPIPSSEELVKLTPRWDLIDFSKYKAHNWHCLDGSDRGNYGVIYTSFGCPFNCYFCNIKALYKGVTYRNPEDVIEEIADLYETHGVRNLKVCDELFVLNHKHVERICDLLIERDYDLNIWAYARTDTIAPDILKKLKKAGFNWLAYGFEKGNAHEAVKMTRAAGINVMGNFMFGLPGEDMWEIRRLANKLKCEYVNFYVALPYPGSQWYEELENKPTDWASFDQYSENICADPEVVKFRDETFIDYFTNPAYLRMIDFKFGKQAVNQIQEMLEWSPRNS